MLDGTDDALLDEWFDRGRAELCNGRLVVRSVKLYADGALGSRGAALIEPYDDDPGNRGLLVDGEERMRAVTRRAHAAGFQPCTHAIGDRGNQLTLDIYADVLAEDGDPARSRFRIEHCQVVAPDDFQRFHDLGVIAAMQPTHATSDMYWAQERIGPERIRGAYAWRHFLDIGVPLAFGSDFPVESANPLWGIYAAVTRRDHDGWPEGGWYPKECLSVAEALRAFTAGAAFAGFAEDERGTLATGMDADLVVLDRDIFEVEPAQLLDAAVQMTVVGGDVVFDATTGD
jgi:predicted amidohydrolase YtcJ